MAPSRMADAVGRVLGDRYRLMRPLGTGASAFVFVADDVVLRRRVAVKVLHPALADDEGFLRRFRAEAQVVASLHHPNILDVYDWGQDDGAPYLVMELLEGGSLRALLDRGNLLSPAQAAAIGAEAARALDYAHRRGLVHRDIKPANLIFDEAGRLKVSDFGLARALAEATWTEPAGAVVGTARYAAPEQARGRSLDDRADVYSLALVLIEAITGTVPFAADTTLATLMARIEGPVEVPDGAGPLRPVLEAAGAVDPAERPNALALANDLTAVAVRLPPPAPLPILPWSAAEEVMRDADPTDYPGRPRLYDLNAEEWRATPPARAAETVALAPTPQPPAATVPAGNARPRPRRRLLRRSLVAILVLGFLGAGAAAALAATGAFLPTHPVPSLVGDSESRASAALAPLHFHLRVAGKQYDGRPAGQVVSQRPASGRMRQGSTVSVVLSLGPPPVRVPSLANVPKTQAEADLSRLGLHAAVVSVKPSMTVAQGSVISASPSTGTLLPGQTVSLVVSSGKPTVDIPALSGNAAQSYTAARAALAAAGLGASDTPEYSNTVAAGEVIGTSPPEGQVVDVGTTVTIFVSRGPQLFPVPDVQGDSVTGATQALTDEGFVVSGVQGNPTAAVSGTSPPQGTPLRQGADIQIITG